MYKVGEDGKTPYERQKGRKCNLEVVPFGEFVRYKKLGGTSQERKSLESSWGERVWLGHARGSSESLVGAKDCVVRAWTIRRMPEEERWDPESITEMQGALQGQARYYQAYTFRLLTILMQATRKELQRKLLRDNRKTNQESISQSRGL